MDQSTPLAERMRPKTLDELQGQEHLTARGSILRTAIENGHIPSMILWGPPGTGKTTIANIIAHTMNLPYFQLSAISSGVKEVREVIETARKLQHAILFIDEIHRFNKGQQDALLGAVEKGIITLIGATTENPSFEVNSALLSRCQVYVLKHLSEEDLINLLNHAIETDALLKSFAIDLRETDALIRISGGDARKLLNLLELVVNAAPLPPKGGNAPLLPKDGNWQNESASSQISEDELEYETADRSSYGLLKQFVKEHRSRPTQAEIILWEQLRGKKLSRFKFRRQHIIGNYIADFVCLPAKLIVEVDGLIHQLPENQASDEARTIWFNQKGYQVLRFTNDEVLTKTEQVLQQILDVLISKGGQNLSSTPPLGASVGGDQVGAVITNDFVLQVAQQKIALYDKGGEQHYDIISAFIKSMRGSDPNGAVYWLARMIEGGEDVKFIARRMVIFASEDIGNANPTALVLANAASDAVNKMGYPEARIILSQCATYLASSHKSNAAYMAIEEAIAAVRKHGDQSVPLHIRNAPTGLMKKMGYGKDYKYAHSYEGNFAEQEFLPEALKGTAFYEPGKNPREEELRRFLKQLWKEKYNY